jgi:Flp pilus assembly protein TadD/uncharacterized protein YchJ
MAISRFALVFIGLVILPSLGNAAPSLQDATATFRKGNHSVALDQVNAYLAGKPKDAQGRFLKGLILTELNRTSEAIETFNDLTDEFPELPEPYNNLAVLYANQGQFERAKNSLEMAIRTHPAYATAHENLGDIYAKMASMAYNKALQLDKSNASAQTKLALVKELFGPPAAQAAAKTKVAAVTAKPATMKPAAAASPAQPTTAIETPTQATAPAAATPAASTPAASSSATATPAPATPAPEKPKASAGTEKPKATAQSNAATQAELEQLIRGWAAAWSKKDVDAYLAYYVADYAPPGSTHADWAELRKARLIKPTSIRVEIADLQVKMLNKKAIVSFKQTYESNILKNTTSKTLVFEQLDGAWKITEEIS